LFFALLLVAWMSDRLLMFVVGFGGWLFAAHPHESSGKPSVVAGKG
jgi:hypothetical protein